MPCKCAMQFKHVYCCRLFCAVSCIACTAPSPSSVSGYLASPCSFHLYLPWSQSQSMTIKQRYHVYNPKAFFAHKTKTAKRHPSKYMHVWNDVLALLSSSFNPFITLHYPHYYTSVFLSVSLNRTILGDLLNVPSHTARSMYRPSPHSRMPYPNDPTTPAPVKLCWTTWLMTHSPLIAVHGILELLPVSFLHIQWRFPK